MHEITPELRAMMAKIIAPYGGAKEYMQHATQLKKMGEFDWQGLNPDDLKNRYLGVDEPSFGQLVPTWDLRRSALSIGEMANQIDPASISLYFATREAFLSHTKYGDWEISMKHGTEVKYLRVIGSWELGRALTPPLLYMWGDQLSHWDGHHRIKIALLSGVPVIPFYCKDAFNFHGITPAPDQMHSEAAWRAEC
jgi:hypothetical protein